VLQQVVGRVPIRGRGAGRLPAPGSDLRWAWSGLRPMAVNPTVESPDTGMVTAADHDPVTEGDCSARLAYPGEFGPPWRVRRLRERLGRSMDWDLGRTLELQGDLHSGRARAFLQMLGPDLDRLGGRTAASLLDWDGVMAPTSRPAFLLSRLVGALCRKVGDDEAVQVGLSTTVVDPSRLLRLLAGGLGEEWWDDVGTDRIEGRDEIVAAVLSDLDLEVARTAWGEVHLARLVHPIARVPVVGPFLGRMWGREPFPAGGDDSTLNAFPWSEGRPFAVSAVPTLRFVVEVGGWDECVLSVPPGQSGRPWSSHYGDQTRAVLTPRPVPLPFSDEAVERATVARLILTPATTEEVADDSSD
jgi:penicillin amidase